MKKFLLLFLPILASASAATGPEYSIQAVRYASAKDEVAGLVMGATQGEKINIAMVVWLVRGGGTTSCSTAAITARRFSSIFPRPTTLAPTMP